MKGFGGRYWFISRLSLFAAALISFPVLSLGFGHDFTSLRFMISAVFAIILFFVLYHLFTANTKRRLKILNRPFPESWKEILSEEVDYYKKLSSEEQERFQGQVAIFLGEKKITGVDIELNDKDRVLAAASSVIPVFKLPGWEYTKLNEVLIYPGGFNEDFEAGGGGRIMGLVDGGTTMILSRTYLYSSFKDPDDGTNVGVHEFAHKIDEADGAIDGIPSILLPDERTRDQWREVMGLELGKIHAGHSDINPYGGTNEAEFFSVVSEYFFEAPAKMKRKHPKLHDLLKRIYRQDTYSLFKNSLARMNPKKRFGRRSK